MEPRKIQIGDIDYRLFEQNGEYYAPERVSMYALRRAFDLAVGTSKTINFNDLPGWWELESLYISSPEDSEVTVEILYGGAPFFTDKLLRNETPKKLPIVLVNSDIEIRLTAARSNIDLLLLYLKPAYLAYSQDF